MRQTLETTEADTIAEVERLEAEARTIRARLDRAKREHDRRVLGRQLRELEGQIAYLRQQLP